VSHPSQLGSESGLALDTEPESYMEARALASDTFERRFLSALMVRAQGNVRQAARLADMNRGNLIKLLRKHSLGRPG
jgi:transcriptional regulator of acetoin/glycerol metabolism